MRVAKNKFRRRDFSIYIYLTQGERAAVFNAAKTKKLSVSDWVRRVLMRSLSRKCDPAFTRAKRYKSGETLQYHRRKGSTDLP